MSAYSDLIFLKWFTLDLCTRCFLKPFPRSQGHAPSTTGRATNGTRERGGVWGGGQYTSVARQRGSRNRGTSLYTDIHTVVLTCTMTYTVKSYYTASPNYNLLVLRYITCHVWFKSNIKWRGIHTQYIVVIVHAYATTGWAGRELQLGSNNTCRGFVNGRATHHDWAGCGDHRLICEVSWSCQFLCT